MCSIQAEEVWEAFPFLKKKIYLPHQYNFLVWYFNSFLQKLGRKEASKKRKALLPCLQQNSTGQTLPFPPAAVYRSSHMSSLRQGFQCGKLGRDNRWESQCPCLGHSGEDNRTGCVSAPSADDLPTLRTCTASITLVWKTAQILPWGNHSSSC